MSNLHVKKALAALPKSAKPEQKVLLEKIAEHVADDDWDQFDQSLLQEMSETHYNLAKKREEGEPKLRIYAPKTDSLGPLKTIVDIVSDDLAFLLDSVVAEINKRNYLIELVIHPILWVSYKKGALQDINDADTDVCIRQSHIHIHIKDSLSDAECKALYNDLMIALNDVYTCNQDWKAMLAQLKQARRDLENARTRRPLKEIRQYCAFLDYLYDNNFTLLGYREYEFVDKKKDGVKSKTVKNSSLGLLHDDVRPAYINESDEGLPRNLQELRRNLPPLSISKTNRLSTVHRRVPMDAIAIKVYDESGNITGEKLFLGLFTSVTYSRSVSDVPYLREMVNETLELSGHLPGSHDRKALRHILEKYPRDELFQIKSKDLLKISTSILRLSERQRIALFMRHDPFGRYISCLVYVPRDRFGTALRKTVCKILEEQLGGEVQNFYTSLDDSVFARIMVIIKTKQKTKPKYKAENIERLLQEAGETWPELLSAALIESMDDESSIATLTQKYGEAFPVAYRTKYRANQAIFDIEKIEAAQNAGELQLDLYRPDDLDLKNLRLKVYNPGTPVTLSDVMPILENMGLRAISELPFEITPEGEDSNPVWIHDFLLETPDIEGFIDIPKVKENFENAFTKIWNGAMENDGLNKLVLKANTNWHETTILRTYVRYLKQIRYPFSRAYVERALNNNPKIARLIVDLFKGLHDPANGKKAESLAAGSAVAIDHALQAVDSLDEDRIMRILTALVEATLRTNYFQRNEDGHEKTYLSIKLDSKKVPEMPEPRPYREIFVYSPRVEAIHLRGDKIARGGLRWSDRHEDFRTEVLGLMKAQMVKNSVIVPMGSKGGFVVKKQTKSRDEFMSEGIECYKTFIRGLLDITDNLKGDKVIPPTDVVRRDGDDPYLVVAADKGTATFSDIANGLSQEYGFWLDDAFASGGSAGYDHKKMGITARGAWESVKLHFRQLNHNTQTQEFDVTGCGDMGGDVFGNGMLLSEKICLIGAFNHMHIFIDPEPHAASAFKERKRLFKAVKGWGDYDQSLMSNGGRIYSRSEKILELTPEIKKRLDITEDKVTPNELIRALLKARTDLLWFGGIGTYIKSTKESHADAGDKSTDALRINADEVRAKVIGEGANLGVTQLGRIEFDERGGKVNSDFVDNSGGVDSSDHEVNIKILLSDVMAQTAHKMTLKSRNILLEKMTNDIAEHVLRNNYQQAQALSLAELQARENLQIQDEFIRDLEREKGLKRSLEGLPDQETVELRMRTGKGLTRPELAILISYAKIGFTQELLDSDIPDAKEMQEWLITYFPDLLQNKYIKEIKRHRLAREIVATTMANSLVNRMGPTFLKSRMNKTGATPAEIAKAYIIVRDAYNLPTLWDTIESLDNKVPAEVQLKAMKEIASLSEHAINWFLTRLGRDLNIGKDIENFGKGITTLRKNLDKLITSGLKDVVTQRQMAGERDGLPKDLAHQIALMPVLSSASDIIRIATEQKTDLLQTARIYFEVGEHFHMDWLRQQARYLPTDDHWHAEATSGLVDQLYGVQASLTVRILKDTDAKETKAATLWMEKHEQAIRRLDTLFAELRRAGTVDLPMLIIAEQRLKNLAGG
ncbi:MAG: NAD-glutamate dehydrogenase [Alphaproteobacteria bacterium]